jgi:phospholipid transport system substrate-binding protein
MVRFFQTLVVSILVGVLCAAPTASRAGDASEVVRGFQAALLDTMKNARTLGVRGRFEKLGPAIENSFHLPLMVATASAPFWRAGTAAQRERLLAAFRRMSASTVATLFDDYEGESFRIVRERKATGPTVLVDTQILRHGSDPVDVTYVAARMRDRWWLIDIVVEGGISEIKIRRNEYAGYLREGGLDRLAQALEDRATRLLSGKPATAAAE